MSLSQIKNIIFHKFPSNILLLTLLSLVINTNRINLIEGKSHYCETQEDCGDFMICLENQCFCDDDDFGENVDSGSSSSSSGGGVPPDLSVNSCKNYVRLGDKCDSPSATCIDNSVCGSDKVCRCPEGSEVSLKSQECMRSYGSFCDSEQHCNPEKFFSCLRVEPGSEQRTCRCHNEDDTTYDMKLDTCVSRIGHTCELQEWMGIQQGCVVNANCSELDSMSEEGYYGLGICKCNPGYTPNPTLDRCEPLPETNCTANPSMCKRSHGDECDSVRVCDGEKFLSCTKAEQYSDRKVCQCQNQKEMTYDSLVETCVSRIGYACEGNNEQALHLGCVQNANCVESHYKGENASFRTCKCKSGYVQGLDHCEPIHKSKCTSDTDCKGSHNLECVERLCECKEGSVFDPVSEACRYLGGTECSTASNVTGQCVQNAECMKVDDELVCQCKETYKLTQTGLCVPSYRTICNLQDGSPCPRDLGLTCVGQKDFNKFKLGLGTCSCLPGSGKIFDKSTGRCRLRFGEPCDPSSKKCISSAFCGTGNLCKCYSGYSPTPQGNCLSDFEQPCDHADAIEMGSGRECNIYSGLYCIDKTCSCLAYKVYNETSGKCDDMIVEEEDTDEPNSTTEVVIKEREEPRVISVGNEDSSSEIHTTTVVFIVTGSFLVLMGLVKLSFCAFYARSKPRRSVSYSYAYSI